MIWGFGPVPTPFHRSSHAKERRDFRALQLVSGWVRAESQERFFLKAKVTFDAHYAPKSFLGVLESTEASLGAQSLQRTRQISLFSDFGLDCHFWLGFTLAVSVSVSSYGCYKTTWSRSPTFTLMDYSPTTESMRALSDFEEQVPLRAAAILTEDGLTVNGLIRLKTLVERFEQAGRTFETAAWPSFEKLDEMEEVRKTVKMMRAFEDDDE